MWNLIWRILLPLLLGLFPWLGGCAYTLETGPVAFHIETIPPEIAECDLEATSVKTSARFDVVALVDVLITNIENLIDRFAGMLELPGIGSLGVSKRVADRRVEETFHPG